MSKDLAFALSARAAFATIKSKLEDKGVDVSDVKYITDLPAVLSTILPDDLSEAFSPELVKIAQELLKDEDTLTALFDALGALAPAGGVVNAMYRPEKIDKDGDLLA